IAPDGDGSRHPGPASLADLHSSRASHGPSIVGCTTLSTKELFGREPDRLGRRGQSVRLHLSPAAIPAGATRLVVVQCGSAAGPTGTGRHGRNHRGGPALQPRGGASPCPCRGAPPHPAVKQAHPHGSPHGRPARPKSPPL